VSDKSLIFSLDQLTVECAIKGYLGKPASLVR
jgi:hypothetical protein